MWFDIKWDVLVVNLLPTYLRRSTLVAYVQALVSQIKELHYRWFNFRIENIYKLEHTNQICYLRGSLNDKFDPVERRIYIGNGLMYDTQYIFTEAEEQDVWLDTESEPETLWLRTEPETADTGLDFIVYVPEEIYNSQLDGLKAHIDFYKAGGKRYNILIDE